MPNIHKSTYRKKASFTNVRGLPAMSTVESPLFLFLLAKGPHLPSLDACLLSAIPIVAIEKPFDFHFRYSTVVGENDRESFSDTTKIQNAHDTVCRLLLFTSCCLKFRKNTLTWVSLQVHEKKKFSSVFDCEILLHTYFLRLRYSPSRSKSG